MSKKRLVSSSYRSSSSPIKKAKVSRLTDTDEVVEEHKTDDTTKAVGGSEENEVQKDPFNATSTQNTTEEGLNSPNFEENASISWTGYVTQDRSHSCPYLDTIDRARLDFDFEKVCSVSMMTQNVYACLVCGKYFQGRGKGTHAYNHSVTADHHVFINLQTLRFYCLPDNYEVIDNSLQDIKRVINPKFEKKDVKILDSFSRTIRCLDGSTYTCGVMGLNNIKANDYVNVVVQAIMRCKRFRDFFLFPAHYQTCTHPLVLRTGELARKLWCTDNYKSHISPHELLQAVVNTSQKRFQITKQSEAVDFLVWYLNTLSQQLSRKKNTPDIVAECFQGKMVMSSRRMGSKELLNDAVEQEKAQAAEDAHEVFDTKLEKIPFLYLTLDVPPPPLYVDIEKDDIIPQVPLLDLFRKFDGVTEQKKGSLAHTYKITKIPRYLILYIKRFTKNNFFTEKNPTIVKFPIKNLDLEDYYSVGDGEPARYDLLANVVHTGKPSLLGDKTAAPSEGGRYKVQILHKATGSWYEIEDLHISEVSPQAISISEAYLQIYELVHT